MILSPFLTAQLLTTSGTATETFRGVRFYLFIIDH